MKYSCKYSIAKFLILRLLLATSGCISPAEYREMNKNIIEKNSIKSVRCSLIKPINEVIPTSVELNTLRNCAVIHTKTPTQLNQTIVEGTTCFVLGNTLFCPIGGNGGWYYGDSSLTPKQL